MSPAFLLQMGLKSAAICAAALVVVALLRRASAADRAMVLRLALGLLLALPLLSAALPSLTLREPVVIARLHAAVPAAPSPAAVSPAIRAPAAGPAPPAPAARPAPPRLDLSRAAILAYLLGAGLLLARFAAGLATLGRWTRRAEPVADPAWTAALRRACAAAGLRRTVRLLACGDARSPLSWGLRRPVILIDHASLQRPQDAEAILAHEAAHLARGDWPALSLSHLAVALFWFNPLVWRLQRRLVEQAEEAADARAVGGLEPAGYARALLACLVRAGAPAVHANGMAAAGSFSRRLSAILDPQRRAAPSGSGWTLAAMAACAAVATPVAALDIAPTALPTVRRVAIAPAAEAARRLTAATPTVPVQAAAAPVALPAPVAEAAVVQLPAGQPAPAPVPAPAASPVAAAAGGAPAPAAAPPAVVDPDTLMALAVNGVDARYIRSLAGLGPAFHGLDADRLIALKAHGVSAELLRELAASGLRGLDVDQAIALRNHGVTPDYVREMARAGFPGLDADQLLAFRIYDVTAEDLRRAARQRLSADDLIALKARGRL